jgi:hypothetical protein
MTVLKNNRNLCLMTRDAAFLAFVSPNTVKGWQETGAAAAGNVAIYGGEVACVTIVTDVLHEGSLVPAGCYTIPPNELQKH